MNKIFNKSSIKLKFSVFLCVLLLLTVTMLSAFVMKRIENTQKKEYEVYLSQQVKFVNTYIRQLLSTQEEADNFLEMNAPELLSQVLLVSGLKATVYDMEGRELANYVYDASEDEGDMISYALEEKIAYKVIDENVVYFAPLYGDKQIGAIRLLYSLKRDLQIYNDMKRLFFEVGFFVFLLSFIAAYFYFNRYSKYIICLKKEIESIKKGDYDQVGIFERNDELGALSEGIFFMSNQIQSNIKGLEKEQENLKLAVTQLKELEKQQQTFIGNVTHEFKTPLTVIRTYMDLLDMYPQDVKLLEDAKVNIRKETQRVQEMVEKVLHLATLQKYDFEFKYEKLDVKDVLEDVCGRLDGKAQKFDIAIKRQLQPGTIWGDRDNLMHIFVNLIDNAIKYNETSGTICVASRIMEKEVVIEIADTGIGIPKEAREKIFEPFFTIRQNQSLIHSGTGLGLSVVKELVEKQNGHIKLADTREKGTAFLIYFPLS